MEEYGKDDCYHLILGSWPHVWVRLDDLPPWIDPFQNLKTRGHLNTLAWFYINILRAERNTFDLSSSSYLLKDLTGDKWSVQLYMWGTGIGAYEGELTMLFAVFLPSCLLQDWGRARLVEKRRWACCLRARTSNRLCLNSGLLWHQKGKSKIIFAVWAGGRRVALHCHESQGLCPTVKPSELPVEPVIK